MAGKRNPPAKGQARRPSTAAPVSLAAAAAAAEQAPRRRGAKVWYPEDEVRITFRMRRPEYDDLQKFARVHGHSMQSILERALNEMLAQRGIQALKGFSDKTDLPI